MNRESEKKAPRLVIVGAGPAGLTAAAEWMKLRGGSGEGILILEADENYVGGISRTVSHHGCRFDIGGHRFFSKNEEICRWWEERLPGDFLSVRRQSRILYRGKFYDYPLKPKNALVNMGLWESFLCGLSYARSRSFPVREEKSFEDWVSNRFGRRLYRHFFKTYTEKVWGIPCTELSADWAAQRIKGLSLFSAVWNALFGGRKSGGKVIKTLIDRFQYPRLGPGMMWEKTRDDLLKAGAKLEMGRRVTSVLHRAAPGMPEEIRQVYAVRSVNKKGEEREHPGDEFILSLPLRETVLGMEPACSGEVRQAAGELTYRDFITVALLIEHSAESAPLFPDNWIYIHDPNVLVGRIQNFNQWSPEMVPAPSTPGKTLTCLGLEYFCTEGDELWNRSEEELLELGRKELKKIELIPKSAGDWRFADGAVVRMPKAYPVYGMEHQRMVGRLKEELSRYCNLQVCGRNGMHKYNNQDHSMMTGMMAARNIAARPDPRDSRVRPYNLWAVNEDSLYHEEVQNEKNEKNG